jgi:hypothetical protein
MRPPVLGRWQQVMNGNVSRCHGQKDDWAAFQPVTVTVLPHSWCSAADGHRLGLAFRLAT